ncbi:MAG TPA: alpha/beta hydrolase [Streptosporangiaceae bacterium]|nr:alpha/beta hydrolase [Streptosporangiaceae bacterium]
MYSGTGMYSKRALPGRAALAGRAAVAGLTVVAGLTAVTGPAAAARPAVTAVTTTASAGGCQEIRLPVALAPGRPASQTVAATYCRPASWAAGPHEIDVLTPGASYDRLYWDWPQDPALYSYVAKTLGAGRATLDYDRVGTGDSSHPVSTDLTISAETYVLHQLVGWARGSLGFREVNLVGHSLGSVISVAEAGTYQDVSRLVVTGLLHLPNVGTGFATTLLSLLYPAAFDPQFLGQRLDLGYLTTLPGDRAADFYSASADPAVISYDEEHKDVVSATDLATLATTWGLPPGSNASARVSAPVLVMVGQRDAIFCTNPLVLDCSQPAELRATEGPYYASAASLTISVIPATGHDLALHPSADQSFAQISQWITSH